MCFSYEYIYDIQYMLPDILSEEDILKELNDPIFFHETSCSTNREVELDFLEACAIESAANANPHSDIYVLFASPRYMITKKSAVWIRILDSMETIHFHNVDIKKYVAETPAKSWWDSGEIFTSNRVDTEISDFIKFLSLFKYGGTSVDLDVISLKSFDKLSNFAGVFRHQRNLIGNKVFNFDNSSSGRQIAKHCIHEFISNFNQSDELQYGPSVITRVLENVCSTKKISEMTPDRCNFTVFPEPKFHPFEHLVDVQNLAPNDLSIIEGSYAAHFPQKAIDLIHDKAINVFKTIAKTYCSKVYSAAFN